MSGHVHYGKLYEFFDTQEQLLKVIRSSLDSEDTDIYTRKVMELMNTPQLGPQDYLILINKTGFLIK